MGITDQDDNDLLSAGTGDTYAGNGISYTIAQVYFGDVVTINGVPQTLVTLYGQGMGPDTALTIPVVDGKLVAAYSGAMTGTDFVASSSDLVFDLNDITCFARGTMIQTRQGPMRIKDLTAGTFIQTCDNGVQPLRWIGSRKLSARDLSQAQNLRPIRIRKDALGDNQPVRDLLVSPQHRVLVRSKIALRMFGAPEVLVAAKQLTGLPGIELAADLAQVEYFHMLFDRHEIVFSDGAATKSLFTGAQALKSLGHAAREEIFTLFPQLEAGGGIATACPLASGRMGRQLAARHDKNKAPLLSEHQRFGAPAAAANAKRPCPGTS